MLVCLWIDWVVEWLALIVLFVDMVSGNLFHHRNKLYANVHRDDKRQKHSFPSLTPTTLRSITSGHHTIKLSTTTKPLNL